MTYDHWKATNPDDEFLGPPPWEEDEDWVPVCPACGEQVANLEELDACPKCGSKLFRECNDV